MVSADGTRRALCIRTLAMICRLLATRCWSSWCRISFSRSRLSLKVDVDDSTATSDGSVSLGLIVTELVINALKHGFPSNRGGHIDVNYRSQGANWTLSVTDDGVGMPSGREPVKPGLGTSIVEALAKQLGAKVSVVDKHPGTAVLIVHGPIQVSG